MEKINFVNNSTPALNDTILNKLQDNVEDAIDEVQSEIATDIANALQGDYKSGNIVVDSIRSKNIFNINNQSNWVGSSTTSTISNNELTVSGNYFISYLVNVKPNTDYYISATRTIITSTTNTGSIRIFKTDQTTPITSHNTGNFTFNSGNNTQVYILFYSGSGSNGVVKFSNIQLEEGDTATAYRPYQNLDAGPVLAWQNSNIGVQFNAQDVNISNLNEFTYYEIIYKQSTTAQAYNYMQSSGKIPVGQNCCLGGGVLRISAAPRFWARFVTYGTNKLTFSAGYYETTSDNSASTANDIIVPYQILLYK